MQPKLRPRLPREKKVEVIRLHYEGMKLEAISRRVKGVSLASVSRIIRQHRRRLELSPRAKTEKHRLKIDARCQTIYRVLVDHFCETAQWLGECEIAKIVGVSPSAATYTLREMAKRGLIVRDKNKARMISIPGLAASIRKLASRHAERHYRAIALRHSRRMENEI